MNEVNFELIKLRRKEMHLTLQDMAELLGFKDASTYYKYENGTYKFKANHLPLLASKLKLRMNQIFLVA
jgi:transcriptional regulator with XRE-family HTH domain